MQEGGGGCHSTERKRPLGWMVAPIGWLFDAQSGLLAASPRGAISAFLESH